MIKFIRSLATASTNSYQNIMIIVITVDYRICIYHLTSENMQDIFHRGGPDIKKQQQKQTEINEVYIITHHICSRLSGNTAIAIRSFMCCFILQSYMDHDW